MRLDVRRVDHLRTRRSTPRGKLAEQPLPHPAFFHHTALGLQVVIEDYIHSDIKFGAIIGVRLGCYGLAVIGIVTTLHVALGG